MALFTKHNSNAKTVFHRIAITLSGMLFLTTTLSAQKNQGQVTPILLDVSRVIGQTWSKVAKIQSKPEDSHRRNFKGISPMLGEYDNDAGSYTKGPLTIDISVDGETIREVSISTAKPYKSPAAFLRTLGINVGNQSPTLSRPHEQRWVGKIAKYPTIRFIQVISNQFNKHSRTGQEEKWDQAVISSNAKGPWEFVQQAEPPKLSRKAPTKQ